MGRLIPCPACSRHVLTNERACPFCGAELPANVAPSLAPPRTRMGRAAMFAAGATLVGAGACKDGTPVKDAAADQGALTDAAGGTGVGGTGVGGTGVGGTSQGGAGGGTGGASGTGGALGTGGIGPLYGAPAIDAGSDIRVLPPLDAGIEDSATPADAAEDRNFMPIYGLSGSPIPPVPKG